MRRDTIRNRLNAGFVGAGALAGVALLSLGAASSVVLFSSSSVVSVALQPESADQSSSRPAPPARGGPERMGPMGEMGMKLIAGLKETEGCLGVDTGRMMSGKTTIIAWFENKGAVKEWYYSMSHERLLDDLVAADEPLDHEPLAFIEDETIPIMVIVSMTFAEEGTFDSIDLPISQIAVELFAPLPGGLHLGGRLSPETFIVPHMLDLEK